MAKKLNTSIKRSPHASGHENDLIDRFVASGSRRNSKQFHDLIALWQAKRADKLEELDRLQAENAEKYRAAKKATRDKKRGAKDD